MALIELFMILGIMGIAKLAESLRRPDPRKKDHLAPMPKQHIPSWEEQARRRGFID